MADSGTRSCLTAASPSREAGRARAGGTDRELKRILRHERWARALKMRSLYLLLLGPITLVIIFNYIPMYGVLIAFKDYRWGSGIFRSPWNDFEHFRMLFENPFLGRVLFNTVYISVLRMVFGFPAPIVLALLVNEIGHTGYKKTIQTITYLPHFISWVILAGILIEILSPSRGPIAHVYVLLGREPVNWLINVPTFRGLLVVTGVWKGVGWGAIVYLAALSSIDPSLYESAAIDGANRFQQAVHITVPCLVPVITILFILSLGNILNAGFEQIFNLYSPLVYEVADVLDTFIYRVGLLQTQYGFGAAVGLVKNVVGLVLIVATNTIIRRFSEYGIW